MPVKLLTYNRLSTKKLSILLIVLFYSLAGLYGQSPIVLINEDFTDGKFDDVGSGTMAANYALGGSFSGGTGFYTPNNRPQLSKVLARKIYKANGGAWGGVVQWGIYNDPHNRVNTNLKKFYIDKYQDVVVVKFGAFADAADAQEIIHSQITLMNWNEDFAGHPHYWHDISIEADQYFQVRGTPVRQLAGNVNVVRNNSADGINNTHYDGQNGYAEHKHLGKVYDNLVTWRYVPGIDKTNIELWGDNTHADYFVDVGLHNRLDNDNFKWRERYAHIDHVQFTFFRPVEAVALKRASVNLEDIQVGFTYAVVGFTKKSDFNLDFAINDKDATVLLENWGITKHATIRQGDANNDEKVNMMDVPSLVAYWSDTVSNVKSRFSLNADNQLIGTIKGISYLKIETTNGTFNENFIDTAKLSPVKILSQNKSYQLFTTDNWNITNHNFGNPLASSSDDTTLLTFNLNHKGSQRENGYTFDLDQTLLIQNTCLCPGFSRNIALDAPDSLSYDWDLPISISGNSTNNTIRVKPAQSFEGGLITVTGTDSAGNDNVKGYIHLFKKTGPIINAIDCPDTIVTGEEFEVRVKESGFVDHYLWDVPESLSVLDGDSSSVLRVQALEHTPEMVIKVRGESACGQTAYISDTIFVKNKVNIVPASYSIIDVFPNPAKHEVTISSKDKFYALQVINLQGQQILSKPVRTGTNKMSIGVSNIQEGVYIIVVHFRDVPIQKKIAVWK